MFQGSNVDKKKKKTVRMFRENIVKVEFIFYNLRNHNLPFNFIEM